MPVCMKNIIPEISRWYCAYWLELRSEKNKCSSGFLIHHDLLIKTIKRQSSDGVSLST